MGHITLREIKKVVFQVSEMGLGDLSSSTITTVALLIVLATHRTLPSGSVFVASKTAKPSPGVAFTVQQY